MKITGLGVPEIDLAAATSPAVSSPPPPRATLSTPLAPLAQQSRAAALAPWLDRAAAALGPPRPPANEATPRFSTARLLTEASAWEKVSAASAKSAPLTTLLGADAETLVPTVARALLDVDNAPIGDVQRRLAAAVYRRAGAPVPAATGVDPQAVREFTQLHRAAITEAVRGLLAERRRGDAEELKTALAQNPSLSLHELTRGLRERVPHVTSEYLTSLKHEELAPHLKRVVDRMGDEPNYLIAAHLAHFMLGAPAGSTYASVAAAFRKMGQEQGWFSALEHQGWNGFNEGDVAKLAAAYPFVPAWAGGIKRAQDAGFGDLPKTMLQRLVELGRVPFASRLLEEQAAVRGEYDTFKDAMLVTTEHALADKIDLFRALIVHDGMRGGDIKVVWKRHSADPLVLELSERCFGVRGEIASGTAELTPDQDLAKRTQELTEATVRGAQGRPIFLHLQGVHAWKFAADLTERYPDAIINASSHTTSDADEIRAGVPGLDRLALSVMADSEAKIRYERYVFTPTFTRLLLEVDKTLETHLGSTIRNRRFVVYGGAGKIIGSAVVDALKSLKFSTAVVDPALSRPEGQALRRELRAAGVDVLDTQEDVKRELIKESCFVINATASDVFGRAEYQMLGRNVVTMNLGTGQRGFSPRVLEELSHDAAIGGPNRREIPTDLHRHQASYVYRIHSKQSGGPIDVVALGDNAVFNLGERDPNPRSLSAFNNMLIIDSLHQAAWDRKHGRMGPRVLSSVRVAFTKEASPRPMISFLPRDTPASLKWPMHLDASLTLPESREHAVVIRDFTAP